MVKNSGKEHRRRRRCGFDPWVGKIPQKKKWQSTTVFLPGESHGQKCLVGYSPWGHKESDTTEVTSHSHIWFIMLCNVFWIARWFSCVCVCVCQRGNFSVVSDSLQPHGLYPSTLLCPGGLQAGILEWVAIPFSRGSSQPRDLTQVSHIAGRFFTLWATREALDLTGTWWRS